LLAWGRLTLVHVLSGIVVAAVLLVAFPLWRRQRSTRPNVLHILRLVGYVLSQLVVSNVVMARQILRRRPTARPGVLAHRLRRPSEEVVTVMTTIISLSPGTMVADVAPDSTTVYVHFYELGDVERARESLRRLEALVVAAVGAPDPVSEDTP
jgi:multicomponent Na+:H+ antiporter subunit E